jgi:hypothetical protein
MTNFLHDIDKRQLLAEFEDLLRALPGRDADSLERESWEGRALALVNLWSSSRAITFEAALKRAMDWGALKADLGHRDVMRILHQARHELRLQSVGPLSVAVDDGGVFAYFDGLRKIIEEADRDVLFVDPYLDAEFVSRYLPHIRAGTLVRLLTRERIAQLLPAVAAMSQESGLSIEVRTAAGFHDRYVLIDSSRCYQSGASFKVQGWCQEGTNDPNSDRRRLRRGTQYL